MTAIEHKPDFDDKKDISYLALTGELWSVFCEYFLKKKMTVF